MYTCAQKSLPNSTCGGIQARHFGRLSIFRTTRELHLHCLEPTRVGLCRTRTRHHLASTRIHNVAIHSSILQSEFGEYLQLIFNYGAGLCEVSLAQIHSINDNQMIAE